jgi:glyoxylase-like metal-dependent hydrolase (beta-lactamase superfamily II)
MLKVETLKVGFLKTNCYIAYNPETLRGFVIDPGYRGSFIADTIKKLGVTVEYIFITHAHFDHITALADVAAATGAKVGASAHDAELIESADPDKLKFNAVKIKPTKVDIILHDEDELTCGGETLRILQTPGHSIGSICIDTGEYLFTGDTLFLDTCGRVDFEGGNVADMLASLRRLAALDGERVVYPGHEDATTLSRERRENPEVLAALC